MRESRIFIETTEIDGNITYSVGGGLNDNGVMECYDNLKDAMKDLTRRAEFDNKKMNPNYYANDWI